KHIPIQPPIPPTTLLPIDLPNQNPTTLNLPSILQKPPFKNPQSKLTLPIPLTINNQPLLIHISKTPHPLIPPPTIFSKS
ncbi:hypothetical protein, partial [Staphylococcus saprophyticus]|uniref:hypothetical protein n=1 Tax=Staphylococcus saprophyticus TaxID=29385 RepID=UPI001C92FD52